MHHPPGRDGGRGLGRERGALQDPGFCHFRRAGGDGGFLFSIKLSGGAPAVANGFLLPAIVAVLVGGTPLTGGVGGVLNTAIGTMIVAVIRASMLYLGVEATQQQMVFGLVLIAAIALTIDRSKLRTVK